MSPGEGKRTGEDPSKLLSHSHPRIGGNEERAFEIECKRKLVR
jgi:hypothetical protein